MTQFFADFGPLVIAEDINEAVLATLRFWLPTHIHQVERDREITEGSMGRPKGESYATVRREQDWNDHRCPMVIVETAGTTSVNLESGLGDYSADWGLSVSAVFRGQTYPVTQKYTSLFEGAIRRVMLMQSPLMPGRCRLLAVEPIRPVVEQGDSGRYMCIATGHYIVSVDSVARSGAGPIVPDPDDPPVIYPVPPDPDVPYDPYGIVEGVTIDIDGRTPSQTIGG